MIFVNGVPFLSDSTSDGGREMVISLLKHPDLVSASHSFCGIPERKFSVSESQNSKWVYVFQSEYATVDPALVEMVGTDEATTCVGIVIRNCTSGMTCVAHLDSPEVVDIGLSQMLSLVSDTDEEDAVLDVHLLGAFEDCAASQGNDDDDDDDDEDGDRERVRKGYSFPLCMKIVEKLGESKVKFQICNFQVLKNNTRWDSEGNAYPIFHGLLVETSSGRVVPASFDTSTRGPDEIIRRIRLGASWEDPTWTPRLLDTYDTLTDRFLIPPFSWSMRRVRFASVMRHSSDLEILLTTSTSPTAEGPDFVHTQKRVWEYLIQHPDWREAFPSKLPRVFHRTATTNWSMSSQT